MEKTAEKRPFIESRGVGLSAIALAGGLVLAGCGGGGDSAESSTVARTSAATETQPSRVTASSNELPTLVFDDLHGGSSFIKVYPGVTGSAADTRSNGTFKDGDEVSAECKAEGRAVRSDTSVGEEVRTSDDWIRIHGSQGVTQYATAVYVENPAALLRQLPDC